MTREDFSFASGDGIEIACFRWPASTRAVGIVQIAHGMGEHSLRYAHVAEFLSNAGFHTYSNDHRGHGRSAKTTDALGDFASGGWDALVSDMAALTKLARTRDA
ncbi:MAG: alpha/beta hydrolase, partial [bacterium]